MGIWVANKTQQLCIACDSQGERWTGRQGWCHGIFPILNEELFGTPESAKSHGSQPLKMKVAGYHGSCWVILGRKCYPLIFRDYFLCYEVRIPSWTNQDFMFHVAVLIPVHMRDEHSFENKSNAMVQWSYPKCPYLKVKIRWLANTKR